MGLELVVVRLRILKWLPSIDKLKHLLSMNGLNSLLPKRDVAISDTFEETTLFSIDSSNSVRSFWTPHWLGRGLSNIFPIKSIRSLNDPDLTQTPTSITFFHPGASAVFVKA